VANFTELRPTQRFYPYMLIREGAQQLMPSLMFRGAALAFGAGTNTTTMIVHVARPLPNDPQPGEPSSFGLPIPSW